jgi:cation diffusion facilitator CzcD-associated flavoprotein CzcO
MSELTAVIVGAGFSGLCAGIELRRAGIHSFVILEKADGVGGTWRDNTYPGAACDVPSHVYSYSFEPNPTWSRAYGGQREILAYLERCATKYELRPHLRLGHRVTGASYDEAKGTWTVETDRGATFTARTLILGNGALHVPAIPELPGLASFAGTTFHSARWDHAHALAGRRVGVIGTGASAIQFVPQIAPEAGHLALFQRTPAWIVPKLDRELSSTEQWAFAHVPGSQWLRRTGLYWGFEARWLAFRFKQLNRLGETMARRHLARQVPDPALRAKLTPDYRLGCKRILLSNDFYPALQRPNVDVVTAGIERVEPAGIRTKDGALHELDTIIFGTGFRVTDYVSTMAIRGRGGVDLNDTWRAHVHNYLGITVSGFPNMFLLMGPNTGLGHNSMVFMIEAQVHYAVQAIKAMRARRATSIEVRPEVERAFHAEMTRRFQGTVWTSGCNSWYQAPDGDVLLWPSLTVSYWLRTRTVRLDHYALAAG